MNWFHRRYLELRRLGDTPAVALARAKADVLFAATQREWDDLGGTVIRYVTSIYGNPFQTIPQCQVYIDCTVIEEVWKAKTFMSASDCIRKQYRGFIRPRTPGKHSFDPVAKTELFNMPSSMNKREFYEWTPDLTQLKRETIDAYMKARSEV